VNLINCRGHTMMEYVQQRSAHRRQRHVVVAWIQSQWQAACQRWRRQWTRPVPSQWNRPGRTHCPTIQTTHTRQTITCHGC